MSAIMKLMAWNLAMGQPNCAPFARSGWISLQTALGDPQGLGGHAQASAVSTSLMPWKIPYPAAQQIALV